MSMVALTMPVRRVFIDTILYCRETERETGSVNIKVNYCCMQKALGGLNDTHNNTANTAREAMR